MRADFWALAAIAGNTKPAAPGGPKFPAIQGARIACFIWSMSWLFMVISFSNPIRVTSCRHECVAATTAIPQTAVDLLDRADGVGSPKGESARTTSQNLCAEPLGAVVSLSYGCGIIKASSPSGHCQSKLRGVGIFLKEHYSSLIVFENVDPLFLYKFACSLYPHG